MDKPVVSVILPIYRVEPYLRKCLDSIIQQTYRHLEMILVDDGSPDNCGRICDEYARLDERIRVVHKPNGGVSSARNAGLDAVTNGEWIMWVDPDDWIEPDMVELLLEKAAAYGAAVVGCGFYIEYANSQAVWRYPEEEILEGELVVEKLLRESIPWGMTCKLWRRELFSGQRFPEEQLVAEDLTVAYSILKREQRILCLTEAKYHILQRAGSATHTSSLKKVLDVQRAYRMCCEDARKIWPHMQDSEAWYTLGHTLGIWFNYYTYPKEGRVRYRHQIEELSAFAREHRRDYHAMRGQLGAAGRAVLPLRPYTAWWSFALAGFWGCLYRHKMRRIDAGTLEQSTASQRQS